jgi:hypothetical protein
MPAYCRILHMLDADAYVCVSRRILILTHTYGSIVYDTAHPTSYTFASYRLMHPYCASYCLILRRSHAHTHTRTHIHTHIDTHSHRFRPSRPISNISGGKQNTQQLKQKRRVPPQKIKPKHERSNKKNERIHTPHVHMFTHALARALSFSHVFD